MSDERMERGVVEGAGRAPRAREAVSGGQAGLGARARQAAQARSVTRECTRVATGQGGR